MSTLLPCSSAAVAATPPAGTDVSTVSAPAAEAPIPDWVRFFTVFPQLEDRILTAGDEESRPAPQLAEADGLGTSVTREGDDRP